MLSFDRSLSDVISGIPVWLSATRHAGAAAHERLKAQFFAAAGHKSGAQTSKLISGLVARIQARVESGVAQPEDSRISPVLFVWVALTNSLGVFFEVLWRLAANPQLAARVRSEVDAVRADAANVEATGEPDRIVLTLEGLKQLPYLAAVINEAMRMVCVGLSVRKTPAEHDVLLKAKIHTGESLAFTLPRNTLVVTKASLCHFDANYFPEPHAFKPERFLADPKLEASLVVFGGGTHRCPGNKFVLGEIRSFVANLLARFDVELVDKSAAKPALRKDLAQIAMSPQSDVTVRFRRRVDH